MKKITIFLLMVSACVTVSCDDKFGELNVSPNNAETIPAHLLLGNVVRNTQNTVYSTFNGGDMGLCWAQQWSKVEYNDEEQYRPRQVSMDNIWNVLYINVLTEARQMELLAEKEENTNLQGIAIILQVNAFQILTDLYGPIPFTEALDEANIKPKYDSEKVIYDGLVGMLEKADGLLASGQGSIPLTSDIVFKGNVAQWKKLGNALKLKVLMRVSKVAGANNDKIQALVNAGGLMSSNADNAVLNYLGAQPDANPIFETIVFGQRSEYKMATPLVDMMNDLGDSRLKVYAQPIANGTFVGNIPGVRPASATGISSIGTLVLSPTFPGVIMSFAQQQLLLAEAANELYIAGGIDVAKTYYVSGISASAQQFGTSMDAGYFSQESVDFNVREEARQKISEQEWIALYGQGLEAWTEWRRTKFPVLEPVVGATVPFIPSRLLYNSLEATLNKANFDAASTSLGGNTLGSKLIWVK